MKPLYRFRKDKRGVLYLTVMFIITILAVAFVWYMLARAVSAMQSGVVNQTSSEMWISDDNWNAYYLANAFMNNLWQFFLVFLVLGLLYYGYIFSQRRGQGGYG
jgi:hypothetical protein